MDRPTTDVQVDHRVTRSLTKIGRYIIIGSECSAQMDSEQAGDCSSSSRNNASSTIEGKGDNMIQAHPEGPYTSCVASSTKEKGKEPILRTNPRLEAPLPPFLRTTFRNSA